MKVTPTKNCLTCRLFSRCTDVNKSYKFICGKYTEYSKKLPKIQVKDRLILEDEIKEKKKKQKIESYDSYQTIIDQLLNDNSPIKSDIRIDDKDLPKAKNFFEFSTGKDFLNITPFAKQLQIGINLYQEYCPRESCTDVKYLKDIPVDDSYEDILNKVTLLEYSICPKCKRKKVNFIRKNKLCDKFELAANCGQRSGKCLVGDTTVKTSIGNKTLKELWDLSSGNIDEDGFNKLDKEILVYTDKNNQKPITHTYKTRGKTIRITFDDGTVIEGLAEHKIWILNIHNKPEFKKLDEIKEGDTTCSLESKF